MKYLVLSPIDIDKSRYYPGEQAELMKYIGDQLVQKGILLPITEEVAPVVEKKKKAILSIGEKLTPLINMSTAVQSKPVVDIVANEVVTDGSIDS